MLRFILVVNEYRQVYLFLKSFNFFNKFKFFKKIFFLTNPIKKYEKLGCYLKKLFMHLTITN